ncbi:MAG: BrnA antitoxin family protein [Methylobacteriaceae bacterium]|nr:BrnA antitoxin family protein [Methylobacteriaceae bacterium]
MSKSERIIRSSANELNARRARGEDRSDLARVRAMSDAEVERAAGQDDEDDISDVDWSRVTVTLPRNKQGVFLRVDPDVLDFFRQGGAGYQTRINAVLKAYVAAMKKA